MQTDGLNFFTLLTCTFWALLKLVVLFDSTSHRHNNYLFLEFAS